MARNSVVKGKKAQSRPRQAAAGPRSLARLLGLFEVLAKSSKGLTLAELNALLKSPKSSLLNLLRPLVIEGYLTYEDGRYWLGTSIFRLSASIMSVWNFSSTLRPYLEELAERSGEIPQDQENVGVCRSGNRSAKGRDILREVGFTQVTSMAGGMNDWIKQGLPVVTGP